MRVTSQTSEQEFEFALAAISVRASKNDEASTRIASYFYIGLGHPPPQANSPSNYNKVHH